MIVAALLAAVFMQQPQVDLVAGARLLKGHCEKSHTSEGRVGSNLRQVPLSCSMAVFTRPNGDQRRGFWQFTVGRERILGFAGVQDGDVLDVQRVYLSAPGVSEPASDAACRLFTKQGVVDAVSCMSVIDHNGQRRTQVVLFKADAGQRWN